MTNSFVIKNISNKHSLIKKKEEKKLNDNFLNFIYLYLIFEAEIVEFDE